MGEFCENLSKNSYKNDEYIYRATMTHPCLVRRYYMLSVKFTISYYIQLVSVVCICWCISEVVLLCFCLTMSECPPVSSYV